jgi:serine/threonine protein kinase
MHAFPVQLGEFRLDAILGHGGSGIVYDATWGPRRVALKVLHPHLIGTERMRAQFLAEAQRLQTIAHPAVVKVLAVGELPDARPYLAMERLEGETLASVLARGPLALTEALALFSELCSAVGALHEQNLIHRDLKPENVFIVNGRHAVLLDFGIAKELAAPASTTTMDGGVRGTPAYMAPERFFGQPAGLATDIYELAVTLYATLAGRLPWDDFADPEARLSPRPLVDFAAIPGELDIEIRRAMSTRAQNRPISAAALLEAVRSAAGAVGAPTAADTARMAPAPPADRKPWFAERHATTDRGKTPLAWAPTEASPPPQRKPRRRWPLAVGVLVVAVGATGLAAWKLVDDEDAPQPAAAIATPDATLAPADAATVRSTDPWDQPNETPVAKEPPKLTLSGPELPIADARREAAAAIVHVPADTRVLFSVTLDELRKHPQFDDILDRIKKQPTISVMVAGLPACVQSVIAGSAWAVFASQALDDADHAVMILRGRWTRSDIEQCFAEDSIPLKMPDGKTMLQLRRVGWIDFLDDHTIYISVRDDLAAAQVHDLVKRGNGPTARTKQLLAKLPGERSVAVVVDGSDGFKWPEDHLPRGSDLTAWLRVDSYSELELAVDTHSDAGAEKLVASVKPMFDDLFKDRQSAILGSVTVARDRTLMRIRGKLSSLLVGMISSAIP